MHAIDEFNDKQKRLALIPKFYSRQRKICQMEETEDHDKGKPLNVHEVGTSRSIFSLLSNSVHLPVHFKSLFLNNWKHQHCGFGRTARPEHPKRSGRQECRAGD